MKGTKLLLKVIKAIIIIIISDGNGKALSEMRCLTMWSKSSPTRAHMGTVGCGHKNEKPSSGTPANSVITSTSWKRKRGYDCSKQMQLPSSDVASSCGAIILSKGLQLLASHARHRESHPTFVCQVSRPFMAGSYRRSAERTSRRTWSRHDLSKTHDATVGA